EALADLCAAEQLWHHVDGAYGAFFYLVPELRETLRGLARADSLTLDPHKGMFLPYGTGALLVRDGAALRAAHEATASYLPAMPLFAFHLTWPGAAREEEDAATRALVQKTTARRRVMLTGCETHGRYMARVCILSFRTHDAQIDALVEDLAAAIQEIR